MPAETLSDNKQLALRFLERAFGMDMKSAIGMLTDDATWWTIGDPGRFAVAGLKNRDQAVRMLSAMHKVLPEGMRLRIIGITAEADRVAVECEAEGNWHDGRPYRNTYHFLLCVRDEKVAVIREYLDPLQIPV